MVDGASFTWHKSTEVELNIADHVLLLVERMLLQGEARLITPKYI